MDYKVYNQGILEADLGLLQQPFWQPLTITRKRSILDVPEALDLTLYIIQGTSYGKVALKVLFVLV